MQRRRKKCFLVRSGALRCHILLAQEGTPLLSRIYDEDHYRCSHCKDQEYFHAHRIARSLESVLYRELANAKQKCN